MCNSILRAREVRARLSISNSWLYQSVADGRFVPPIKLGRRASGWLSSEVDTFLERFAAGDDAADITKALVSARGSKVAKEAA